MKKKILLPFLATTMLVASTVPSLTSCNNKKKAFDGTVTKEEWLNAWAKICVDDGKLNFSTIGSLSEVSYKKGTEDVQDVVIYEDLVALNDIQYCYQGTVVGETEETGEGYFASQKLSPSYYLTGTSLIIHDPHANEIETTEYTFDTTPPTSILFDQAREISSNMAYFSFNELNKEYEYKQTTIIGDIKYCEVNIRFNENKEIERLHYWVEHDSSSSSRFTRIADLTFEYGNAQLNLPETFKENVTAAKNQIVTMTNGSSVVLPRAPEKYYPAEKDFFNDIIVSIDPNQALEGKKTVKFTSTTQQLLVDEVTTVPVLNGKATNDYQPSWSDKEFAITLNKPLKATDRLEFCLKFKNLSFKNYGTLTATVTA